MLTAKKIGHGLVIGKFMPLHDGHAHLLYFAQNACHKLTILVCSLETDPIPGEIRYGWMKEMFPLANVVHHYADIPQEPSEHPLFWTIWKQSIARHCPGEEFDAVFGSEDYGWRLAAQMNTEYIPVNRIRNQVPISGTAMRTDPMKNWQYLPTVVKPYFVRRIALLGPESVGKTSLSEALGEIYKTPYVDEYGRRYLEEKIRFAAYRADEFRPEDIPNIARGQIVSEDSLAHRANKILICDTDVLTTSMWSNFFFKSCPQWIEEEARRRKYAITILLAPDGITHHQDGTRIMVTESIRNNFFEDMQAKLGICKRPFVIVSGNWQERLMACQNIVELVLKGYAVQ